MQGIITIGIDCGGQCRSSSSYLYGQCVDFFSALGIQDCNQGQCESKIYNLSACITTETAINPTSSTNHVNTNSIATTEQSQATTTTTVYRSITETAGRTDAQDISCTTKPLSTREVQALIGALVGLVMVLLVMAIIPWIWICWKFKVNNIKRPKGDKQQIRYIYLAVMYTSSVINHTCCRCDISKFCNFV